MDASDVVGASVMVRLPILAGRLANRSIFAVCEIEEGAWGRVRVFQVIIKQVCGFLPNMILSSPIYFFLSFLGTLRAQSSKINSVGTARSAKIKHSFGVQPYLWFCVGANRFAFALKLMIRADKVCEKTLKEISMIKINYNKIFMDFI